MTIVFLLLSVFAFVAPVQPDAALAASMEHKLQHIESNAKRANPDQTPTELTQEEINAYLAAGRVSLPAGVKSVQFEARPGVVTASSEVDFDEVKAGRSSFNPLLAVFSGVHDVVIAAHAHGAGGRGYVNVDSMTLDDVEIPRVVLELFVEKYIQPKHPDIGLDSQFRLPARIDIATVEQEKLVIIQK